MTTELDLQLKIQGVIQGLSIFADADIVINDWTIFDRPNIEAPYVLITTSDDFESKQDTMTPQTRWAIPIVLVERFEDWKTTYDNFQARRQAIIDVFNGVGDERSGSGVNIGVVLADAPITDFYDKAIDPQLFAEALPAFIMQRLILETNLF